MMALIKQFIQLEDMLISNKFILIFLCSLLKQLSLSLSTTPLETSLEIVSATAWEILTFNKTSKNPRKSPRDGHRGIASDRKFPPEIQTISSLEMLWLRPGFAGWLRFEMSALSSLKDVMGISRQLYQSEYEMNHIEIYCVLVMSAKKLKQLEKLCSLHEGTKRNRENTELKLLKMFC